MELDLASFMVNHVLHYDSKETLKTKNSNLRNARMFPQTFRIIDDLIVINNNNFLCWLFQSICPWIEVEKNERWIQLIFAVIRIDIDNDKVFLYHYTNNYHSIIMYKLLEKIRLSQIKILRIQEFNRLVQVCMDVHPPAMETRDTV